MKYKKTAAWKRSTYGEYGSDMNGPVKLIPGKGGVTMEWIKLLHRMDDNEVYNNNKNLKAPIQEWEKGIYADWNEKHPYEEIAGHMSVCIDYGWNSEEEYIDSEKSVLAQCLSTNNEQNALVERLRDAVSGLTEEQQVLYHKIVIEQEAINEIAEEYGLNPKAISERFRRIKAKLRVSLEKYFSESERGIS